ncbi:MFS transporter [Paenibacillus sp. JTLBN-2024]
MPWCPLRRTCIESSRGRVVGNVMSGLLLGIMLSRPLSILVADLFGWHAVFVLSGAAVLVWHLYCRSAACETAFLERFLPGAARIDVAIAANHPFCAAGPCPYHACVFATFSLFWTTVPFLLTGPMFHFSQKAIALFALAGIAGAVAAPVAGRLADRGWTRPGTGIALVTVVLSVLLPLVVRTGSPVGVAVLVAAAILLDAGVSANLVLGQRALFSLSPKYAAV